MQRLLFLPVFCAIVLCGCADLSFLDSAVSEAGRTNPVPELLPRNQLNLPGDEDTAIDDATERLLARGAALQRRAAAAQ